LPNYLGGNLNIKLLK